MYAIVFDILIADLKLHYGDPYNGAYDEIRTELKKFGFENTQGSVYDLPQSCRTVFPTA
jgi:virulence-associated protein VapD